MDRGAGAFFQPANGSARRVGELVVGTVFINILALALPLFSLQIYDRILPGKALSTLTALVIAVTIAVMLEIVLRIERAKIIAENGAVFERNLYKAAVRRILNNSLDDAAGQSASQCLHKLQSIRAFRDFHSGYAITVLIDFSFVFVYLALIFQVGGLIVLAPLVVIAIVLANALAGNLALRNAMNARRAADETRYEFLITTLQSISALKCFSLEKLFERRYEPLEYATSAANFHVSRASANMLNASTILGSLMTAAVIMLGVPAAASGSFSIGAIIACILLSGRLVSPLQRGMILWMKYQDYDNNREQFLSLLRSDNPAPRTDGAATSSGGGRLLHLSGLCLQRRQSQSPLLQKTSLSFGAGDIVIVRAGAARKASQLLKAIAGLSSPSGGDIVIDGRPLSSIPLVERPRYVAYLHPSASLFNGSVLENLTRFGVTPQEHALDIARRLGIDRDVALMPNGWNTKISGKSSDEAATGLKHRIAVARALACRPPVILFDDASELLGRRSYDLVTSALTAASRSSVIFLNTTDENLIRFANRELRIADDGAAFVAPMLHGDFEGAAAT